MLLERSPSDGLPRIQGHQVDGNLEEDGFRRNSVQIRVRLRGPVVVEGNMGWFEQSPISKGAIGERQSDKRACLVLRLAQLSVSGVGVELPPVLRGGIVEQPAQRVVFRHAALDVLGEIRCLMTGLGAPLEVYQLLLPSADPPVSDITIPVRVVDRGSDIEFVTHGRQEPRAFRFSIFVFVDVMVQVTRGNSQVGLRLQVLVEVNDHACSARVGALGCFVELRVRHIDAARTPCVPVFSGVWAWPGRRVRRGCRFQLRRDRGGALAHAALGRIAALGPPLKVAEVRAVERVGDVEWRLPPVQGGRDGQTDQDHAAACRQQRSARDEGLARGGGHGCFRRGGGALGHQMEHGTWKAIAQAFAGNSLERYGRGGSLLPHG
ncbi:Hypothetical protein AA314_02033 [Archangium gephyra]|uniref:Uncharacterized protein n=1 Tax=Archangium gephyra TaxID=48 RepID=A0AAC8TBY7_9BACT|nr:Hypothetical protein AA314_02033 [Archangium gephyra]